MTPKAPNLLQLPTVMNTSFGHDPVYVETEIYEDIIAWDRHAMARHGIALDEQTRMAKIISDAATVARYGGGSFITRATHAKDNQESRMVLEVQHESVETARHAWVIRH